MSRANKRALLLLMTILNVANLFAGISNRGRYSDFSDNHADNDLILISISFIAIVIFLCYVFIKQKSEYSGKKRDIVKAVTSYSKKESETSKDNTETQIESYKKVEQKEELSDTFNTKANNWFLAISTYYKWNFEWKQYILTCSKILNLLETTGELKNAAEKSKVAEELINIFLDVTKAEFPQENKKKLVEVLTYDKTCVPDQETFTIYDIYELGAKQRK